LCEYQAVFLLYAQLKEANAQTISNLVCEPVISRTTHLQNREDTISCEGGKSIAIDSKINYLTKKNYRVRKHSGRLKNDVGVPVNLPSCPELKASMITDDIHELGGWYHV
jgi:hypothetical protein